MTSCAADVVDLPPSQARGGQGRHAIVYERTVYFPGLQEEVRIIKGPRFAYGLRPDGSRLGLAALRAANKRAYRQRFGPLALGFHEHLATLAAGERVPAAVYFQPAADWNALSPRLFSTDAVTADAARDELIAAIEHDASELSMAFELRGVTVTGVGRKMPVVFVSATPSQLRALGEDPRVKLVMGADQLAPELRCNGGPDKSQQDCDADGNVVHHVDTVFNSQGYFGSGQRVGIYEDVGDCTLVESHEAFKYLGGSRFVYSNSSPNSCINNHATQVASVLSAASNGIRCGASDVEIYFPNSGELHNLDSGPISTSICHPEATLRAYEWMSEVGDFADQLADPPLAVVNESFGCMNTAITCVYTKARQWEGVTQDYFARMYDMAIVKAAGNDNCGAGQEACPFSLNSICVGSADSSMNMSCFSSSNNPGTDPSNPADEQDREEPDLVAFGGNEEACIRAVDEGVCVANPVNDGQWTRRVGTSFSAPVVASMMTLFREMCEPVYGMRIDQRWWRAILRTAAFGGNPDGSAYSTPRPNDDQFDGAGFLLADMLSTCSVNDAGGGPMSIDLTAGEEMPVGPAPYQDGWAPAGETQSFVQPMDYTYEPGPGADRLSSVLGQVDLVAGDRVRATFSWDGCAIDEAEAPVGVAVDFDLFLYNPQVGYVWASQSLDDNNEGFDYTVQPGEAGTYQVILAWPTGARGCEGSELVPGAFSWAFL